MNYKFLLTFLLALLVSSIGAFSTGTAQAQRITFICLIKLGPDSINKMYGKSTVYLGKELTKVKNEPTSPNNIYVDFKFPKELGQNNIIFTIPTNNIKVYNKIRKVEVMLNGQKYYLNEVPKHVCIK